MYLPFTFESKYRILDDLHGNVIFFNYTRDISLVSLPVMEMLENALKNGVLSAKISFCTYICMHRYRIDRLLKSERTYHSLIPLMLFFKIICNSRGQFIGNKSMC